MKHLYLILLACTFLAGCNQTHKPTSGITHESPVHNLNDSTNIIMHLLRKNALQTVLETCHPEDIDRLVKNFSPAELALESEVLNWETPVILAFVDTENPEYQTLHKLFENSAQSYGTSVKFVEVNTQELFKIAQQFEITQLPTISLMFHRKEIAHLEQPKLENLEQAIRSMIEQHDSQLKSS